MSPDLKSKKIGKLLYGIPVTISSDNDITVLYICLLIRIKP